MRNSISNGNGDSRYMKSAIPENITHEELVALLREGTFPFDFNGINPAGFAQLGQGLTKENLLDDNTEVTIWGDSADRTVNQALLKLALSVYAGEGMVVNVTVQNDAGEPFEGAIINGLFDSSANVMVTDSEGKATGYTTSTSATLSITGFYDLEDTTVTVNGDRGSTQNVTITMKRRNFLSVTSTQSRMFSPFCRRVDVTAVGGGGGGGTAYARVENTAVPTVCALGAGGGGGYVTVKENVVFATMTPCLATVGAGGAVESTGGSSNFLGVVANGGGGATATNYNNNETGVGGVGNGNGSKGYQNDLSESSTATEGTQQGFTSFTEMGKFGGGGACGTTTSETTSSPLAGAAPYGGSGAWACTDHDQSTKKFTNAEAGKGPGGGGGGACYYHHSRTDTYYFSAAASKGYRGVVNIRMWFEEDLAA